MTNKGRKEYIQIEWRHFILREHEKDKDVITTVSQRKGGNSYVKDVDVKQRTIHYDFITAEDSDGNLKKLPRDHMISLGWVYHSDTQPDNSDLVSEGGALGQNWKGELQPTIIVAHPKAESNGTRVAQWMKAEEFQKHIANSGIGWWHLAWVLPVASCFFMGGRYFENTGWILSAIGLGVAAVVAIIRKVQLGKQIKTFSEWLRGEISDFCSRSEGLVASIVSKLQ